MARQSYQDQLEQLREDVLYMSEIVMERLRMGLDALEQKDEELAREVIEGDDEINWMYLDLEQDCIDHIRNSWFAPNSHNSDFYIRTPFNGNRAESIELFEFY